MASCFILRACSLISRGPPFSEPTTHLLPAAGVLKLLALACVLTRRGFAIGFISIAKPLVIIVFVGSGAPLESRVALGLAGEQAFGPPRRPTAGFRRLGGRADVRQKRRNGAMDPDWRKAPRLVAALPRQPQVLHAHARQPELGESGHDQPGPPVGLLRVANPRRRPPHALLEEAEGVLQIETPHIRAPDEIQIRRGSLRPVPPQPQHPRLPSTLAAGQALDLDQDERADHDGQGSPTAPPLVVLDLRMQLGPRPHAHRSVTGVLARVLGGRLWPGARVVALHLRPVATGASDVRGRIAVARVAVEATPRPQADEDLARAPFQPPLQLDGVVARIEDE